VEDPRFLEEYKGVWSGCIVLIVCAVGSVCLALYFVVS
jgi:hypothetical protein